MRERYPALWQLFGSYFQDLALDDATADDVLRRFLRDDPIDSVARLVVSSTRCF